MCYPKLNILNNDPAGGASGSFYNSLSKVVNPMPVASAWPSSEIPGHGSLFSVFQVDRTQGNIPYLLTHTIFSKWRFLILRFIPISERGQTTYSPHIVSCSFPLGNCHRPRGAITPPNYGVRRREGR